MKTWRKVQKVAVVVGMTYGLWLGCNTEATIKDSNSAFVIVALSLVVALSMLIPDKEDKQEKSL